jgi:hypothetical protein
MQRYRVEMAQIDGTAINFLPDREIEFCFSLVSRE